MKKPTWSTFAVVIATFVINGFLFAGVNLLFSGQMRQVTAQAWSNRVYGRMHLLADEISQRMRRHDAHQP